jgi:ribosomal protein L21
MRQSPKNIQEVLDGDQWGLANYVHEVLNSMESCQMGPAFTMNYMVGIAETIVINTCPLKGTSVSCTMKQRKNYKRMGHRSDFIKCPIYVEGTFLCTSYAILVIRKPSRTEGKIKKGHRKLIKIKLNIYIQL